MPERKVVFRGLKGKPGVMPKFDMKSHIVYPMEGGTALVTFEEEVGECLLWRSEKPRGSQNVPLKKKHMQPFICSGLFDQKTTKTISWKLHMHLITFTGEIIVGAQANEPYVRLTGHADHCEILMFSICF